MKLLLPATLTSREARVTLRLLKQTLQSEGSEGPVIVEAAPLQVLDSSGARGAARGRAPGGGLGKGLRRPRGPAQARRPGQALRRRRPADGARRRGPCRAPHDELRTLSAGRRRSPRAP